MPWIAREVQKLIVHGARAGDGASRCWRERGAALRRAVPLVLDTKARATTRTGSPSPWLEPQRGVIGIPARNGDGGLDDTVVLQRAGLDRLLASSLNC